VSRPLCCQFDISVDGWSLVAVAVGCLPGVEGELDLLESLCSQVSDTGYTLTTLPGTCRPV